MEEKSQGSEKSDKQNKQKKVSKKRKAVNVEKILKGFTKQKVKITYDVLPCEEAMRDPRLLESIDRVVESNKLMRGMTKHQNFIEREKPISIGKMGDKAKEYELLVMYENNVVAGFSLFRKNSHDEWSVDWMITSAKRRNVNRMYKLFKTTLDVARAFGAVDLRFELYMPEWKKVEDVYDFFSRGSGNRVSLITKETVFVKVDDYRLGCKGKKFNYGPKGYIKVEK